MIAKLRYLVTVIFLVASSESAIAQEDLLGSLPEETPKKEFQKNAFKATRVITGQSIEHLSKGVLDFRILHRFGRINDGAYEAYGFDQASIRLGLDYGITDRLMIGLGRSSTKKEIDGFLKYRLIWQAKGKGGVPFSLILISGIIKDGLKWSDPDRENYFSSRLNYYHQLIIGRKFSESFSLQFMPTVVHRNLVATENDLHDTKSIGIGSRIKLSKRIAVTAEYFYSIDKLPTGKTEPLSIGFDIETGGHVFQLHFTNALGMNERAFLMDTEGKWDKGDIHFGFNISRVFTLSKPKNFRKNNQRN
jgi:hypothetical protein